MCPQTCLWNLLDAMARNDRVAVNEHLAALADWNARGGFLPTIDRPPGQSVAHFVVRRTIAEAGPTPADLGVTSDENSVPESPPDVASQPLPSLKTDDVRVSPGDHLLLPEGWLDGLWYGPSTAVAVVQRQSEIAASGRETTYVVSPLDDAYREKTLPQHVVARGLVLWTQENSVFGSLMGSLDESSE